MKNEKEYSDTEINDAVTDILHMVFFMSGFNKVGELVSKFGKDALKYSKEKHWNRRIK
jgi:hypothetical protein